VTLPPISSRDALGVTDCSPGGVGPRPHAARSGEGETVGVNSGGTEGSCVRVDDMVLCAVWYGWFLVVLFYDKSKESGFLLFFNFESTDFLGSS
jgi:hypothetical protein